MKVGRALRFRAKFPKLARPPKIGRNEPRMIDASHPAQNPVAANSAERANTIAKVTSPALRAGIFTGSLLVLVMIGSLIAANRFPWLENHALERNAASYGLFVLFMLIPVARFWNQPARMFASGMLAWVMFFVAYDVAGMFFTNLFRILRTPFEALVEGTLIYGFLAVVSWVSSMALHARHSPITPRRRRSDYFSHWE